MMTVLQFIILMAFWITGIITGWLFAYAYYNMGNFQLKEDTSVLDAEEHHILTQKRSNVQERTHNVEVSCCQ